MAVIVKLERNLEKVLQKKQYRELGEQKIASHYKSCLPKRMLVLSHKDGASAVEGIILEGVQRKCSSGSGVWI